MSTFSGHLENGTLFSANHFANSYYLLPSKTRNGTSCQVMLYGTPVPSSVGYNLPLQTLVSLDDNFRHQVSQPPLFVHHEPQPADALAFPEEDTPAVSYIAPPPPRPELSDPIFLVGHTVEPRLETPLPAPVLEKELSDPSFLLGNDVVLSSVFDPPQEDVLLSEWRKETTVAQPAKNTVKSVWKRNIPKETQRTCSPSVESFVSSESCGSKALTANSKCGSEISFAGTISQCGTEESTGFQWHTKTKKKKKMKRTSGSKTGAMKSRTRGYGKKRRGLRQRKQIFVGNSYETKARSVVTVESDPKSREIWTLTRGCTVHMKEINLPSRRCLVECTCTYWSRRFEEERTKHVVGWMSFQKDDGFWTITTD